MARIVIQDTTTGEIRQINDVALPFFPGYIQVDTIDDEFPPTLFYTGAAADARYVNVAEISDPDSPASVALRAALVARAHEMLDDDATDNRAYLQSLADQGGLIILPPTTGRYAIAGTITLNVPGTQIVAWGAPLRQVTKGMTLFDAVAPDCLIDGVDAVGATGTPDLAGMNTAWQGSIIASRWCAVNVYDTAHRLRIPWIRGAGMSSVVRVAAWTKATDVEATTRVQDVEIGTILCDRVEFAIAAKGTERIKLSGVRGTYGNVTNPPRGSHLVYFADGGPGHRQVTVSDCSATAGVNGSAYQLKGITGGQVARLQADGCSGVLNIMDCTDVALDGATSLNDTYSDTAGAAVTIDVTTTLDRLRLRNVKVNMTADARAVVVFNGTNVVIENLSVRANHAVTGTATQYDVDIRAAGVVLRNVEIENVGAAAWRGVGFFSGAGHTLRGLKAANVRAGVDTRSTNARVEYDRRDITLHGVDGYAQLTASPAASGAKFICPQTAQLLAAPTLLVADGFEVPTGSSKTFSITSTGQLWEALSGSWRIDTATNRGFEFNGSTTQAAVVDAGQANVAIEAGILFQSGEGLILRALDNLNYIAARFSAGAVTLSRFDAGTATTLVTQAFTTQTGRRYAMAVRAYADKIDVLVDGVQVLTHTLIAGDQTKFGAATKHGLRSSGSNAARFDSFRVLALA